MKETPEGTIYTDKEIISLIVTIFKVKDHKLRQEILAKLLEGLREGGQA